MGGKKSGGARAPYEAPNTLNSAQRLKIVDAICEGVVAGFANGDDAPLKSVYFNDTPVQNVDGSYNFKGVTALFQAGTPDQSYIPGFEGTERTVAVSASVKQAAPVVRAVSDALISRLRVTVGVERNVQVQDNGDSVAAQTELRIELVNAGGVQAVRTVRFTEKGSGAFYHDELFDSLPAVPFNIRVSRITPDAKDDKTSNNTFFASYVEAADAKLCYPHTALAALLIDSDQFGNQVPRRNYLLRGKILSVPVNYDPQTRSYSGLWDGSFKQAWSNNPAWVFYDLLTNPRYSTLARRLNLADIDKWSLYQAARWCDEPVPDGFGGTEPRFVCNAYITDSRQAGELLQDLASVFTGLPVWNGSQVSVLLDQDTDPVAAYGNHNVEGGLFTYSSAALKSIHTAVHVRYADRLDGWRSKTEYVEADAAAVARYGLNIKSVTAFGCDSRAQAVRVGQWILQTELRQQHTVSFAVGREGLKHLPYDIIQIADNHYAGAQLSGRVLAVDGRRVTLDREVEAAGGLFQYLAPAGTGGAAMPALRALKVSAQPAPEQLLLEAAPEGLAELDGWALAAKAAPRLYRAVGIRENANEGTYTVTALLHDAEKYAAVDNAAHLSRPATLHGTEPRLQNGSVSADGSGVHLTWDNLSVDGSAVGYDIKIYRNGKLFRHIADAAVAEVHLSDLPDGDYRADIRARNARGVLSEPLVQAWRIHYGISGVRATPKTFAVDLSWVLPELAVSALHTEIWYARENNRAKAQKLASLPYPQNGYTLSGVQLSDRFWFWLRITDAAGRSGEWTAPVQGVCDTDPAPILEQIRGQITESALSGSLINLLDGKIAAGVAGEAAARAAAVTAAEQKAARELLAKAQEIGTRVTVVENVNAQQAQQIATVTAAQGSTAAALEAEKKARADGDLAEAQARQALAARHGQTAALVTALQQTVADNQRAAAERLDTLSAQMRTDPDNLCRNPSAEHDTAGWTGLGRETVDGVPVGLAAHRDAAYGGWLAVRPGEVFYCAVRARNKDANHPIGIGLHTQNGTAGDRWLITSRVQPSGAADWVKVENHITVPEGATRARLFLQVLKPHSAAGGFHVRDVEWRRANSLIPLTATLTETQAAVTALSRTVADDRQAAATQVNALRSEMGGSIERAKVEMVPTETGELDLSALDGNTWYPCVSGSLPAATRSRFTVWQVLSAGNVSWSRHGSKNISLMLDWESNGSGWGTIPVRRVVAAFEFNWVSDNRSPVLNLSQMTNSSREVVYLRGGAKYRYSAPKGLGFTLHAAAYTVSGQTVSPRAYDAALVPKTNEAALSASVTETRSTVTALDGKVQSLWSLKTEAVGARRAVAGVALGADGQTGDSQFLVMADKFALVRPGTQTVQTPFVVATVNGQTKLALSGDMVADGTILGRNIAANQSITSPVINGGSLNIGGGQFAVTPAGRLTAQNANITGHITANSGVFRGRIEAEDGYFNGTVRADKIVGDVVKLRSIRGNHGQRLKLMEGLANRNYTVWITRLAVRVRTLHTMDSFTYGFERVDITYYRNGQLWKSERHSLKLVPEGSQEQGRLAVLDLSDIEFQFPGGTLEIEIGNVYKMDSNGAIWERHPQERNFTDGGMVFAAPAG